MKILKSPTFLVCISIFALHQVMQKVMDLHFALFDRYLDNLLAMPIILTLLMIERRFLFRRKHYSLSILEIIIATLIIVFVVEIVFPMFSRDFTRDWWDLLFYGLGSFIFWFTINRRGKAYSD